LFIFIFSERSNVIIQVALSPVLYYYI